MRMTISVQQPPENDNGNLGGGGRGRRHCLGGGSTQPPPPISQTPFSQGHPAVRGSGSPWLCVCAVQKVRLHQGLWLSSPLPTHTHPPRYMLLLPCCWSPSTSCCLLCRPPPGASQGGIFKISRVTRCPGFIGQSQYLGLCVI